MEVYKLIERKEGLEAALYVRIKQMIDEWEKETGCTVEAVKPEYTIVMEYGGKRNFLLSDVKVEIFYDGIKIGG